MWRMDTFSLWGIMFQCDTQYRKRARVICMVRCFQSTYFVSIQYVPDLIHDQFLWRCFRIQIYKRCHAMVALKELARRKWVKILLSRQVICISSINSLNFITSKGPNFGVQTGRQRVKRGELYPSLEWHTWVSAIFGSCIDKRIIPWPSAIDLGVGRYWSG